MESNLNISNMNELDNILNAERMINNNSTWNKLDKSSKLCKLQEFCNHYNNEGSNDDNKEHLYMILSEALDAGKLQKIKDVIYDKEKGEIINIPMLSSMNNRYVLKSEKRVSTSRSLPIKSNLKNTKKKKYKIDNKD
jgi:hypothetical protein